MDYPSKGLGLIFPNDGLARQDGCSWYEFDLLLTVLIWPVVHIDAIDLLKLAPAAAYQKCRRLNPSHTRRSRDPSTNPAEVGPRLVDTEALVYPMVLHP
jgi:hypothetical protein